MWTCNTQAHHIRRPPACTALSLAGNGTHTRTLCLQLADRSQRRPWCSQLEPMCLQAHGSAGNHQSLRPSSWAMTRAHCHEVRGTESQLLHGWTDSNCCRTCRCIDACRQPGDWARRWAVGFARVGRAGCCVACADLLQHMTPACISAAVPATHFSRLRTEASSSHRIVAGAVCRPAHNSSRLQGVAWACGAGAQAPRCHLAAAWCHCPARRARRPQGVRRADR